MSTSQENAPYVVNFEQTPGFINFTLRLETPEPATMFFSGDKGQSLDDIPFVIWQNWVRIEPPRPRFVVLERNEAASIETSLRLQSQVGSGVKVRLHTTNPNYLPDNQCNDKELIVCTVNDFLRKELKENPRSGQTIVVVMHNVHPALTAWDHVSIAGLKAWIERTAPKSPVRCFITSKGSPTTTISMPGHCAHVVVQGAPQRPPKHVYLNHGSLQDRVMEAVRLAGQVFRQNKNARVAFLFDSVTQKSVLPILEQNLESDHSTEPSNPEKGIDQPEEDSSSPQKQGISHRMNNSAKYEVVRVIDEDWLDYAVGLADEEDTKPLLMYITMPIDLLDGYQLKLSSLIVIEPIHRVSQYLDPICKMHVTSGLLLDTEVQICESLLGESPDGPQQSLVRCVLNEDKTAQVPISSPFDLMGILFLTIGFGVESPLATDAMVVDKTTKDMAVVLLNRLLGMKAIVELETECEKNTSSTQDADSNRRFRLGTGQARSVFKYMANMWKTDVNHAWLTVRIENFEFPSDVIALDAMVAIHRLAATFQPSECLSQILLVSTDLDTDTVIQNATNNLVEELSDWEERGGIWYTILLLDIAERQGVVMIPQQPDFQRQPEISQGLFADGEYLSRVRERTRQAELDTRCRGPLFAGKYSVQGNRLNLTYKMIVQTVVDAYPHNLIVLFTANTTDKYACFAWDIAAHQYHKVNDQSFHRVRLPLQFGQRRPVIAVYLTLRAMKTERPNTYVEDILVVPKEITDGLQKGHLIWTIASQNNRLIV